jgi:hypothetical protein
VRDPGCRRFLHSALECFLSVETRTVQLDLLVRRADNIIMSAFEDVVGCGLSPEQRTQASWPFPAGGFGLKTPTMLRPAARISALTAYLASGSERLCLPTYVHTVPSRWVSPLLSDLSANLGAHFDPLPACAFCTFPSIPGGGQGKKAVF